MDRKTNGSRGNTKQKVMTRKDRKAAVVAEVIAGRPDLFSRQSKVLVNSGENDLNQEASCQTARAHNRVHTAQS